jgi:hypothetical protein
VSTFAASPSDDLAAAPWNYPGTRIGRSVVLHDGSVIGVRLESGHGIGRAPAESTLNIGAVIDDLLADLGASALADRHPVVAVGCNASPAVLARKLVDVDTTVPMITARISGLAIGHSAHVSRLGYIAATPFVRSGAVTDVVVTMLDGDQLGCVDITEPNYVRRRVDTSTCRLELDGGTGLAAFEIYTSRWGVICRGGSRVELASQEALFMLLRQVGPPFAAGLASDVRALMTEFARDDVRRAEAAAALAAAGWVADSGFGR